MDQCHLCLLCLDINNQLNIVDNNINHYMSVGNILSKLKDLNNSNVISVYIPSAKSEMSFRPLSVKQQKDLIKSGLDGSLSGITLSNTINDIVTANSTVKYDFLVTDKIPVILALRTQAFGSNYTLKDDDKDIVFNLTDILSKKLKFSLSQETEVVSEDEQVVASLKVINLSDDIKINNFQVDKLKKNKDEQLSETVGSLFIYEIVKFVNKITIGEDELEMETLPIKDRLTIIESLPATLNNQILDYIQKFRKEESEYLTVSGNTLSIDARLFSKE